MGRLSELSGCELVLLASVLAIGFSENLDSEELDAWGNFFSAFGSNLSTIASTK